MARTDDNMPNSPILDFYNILGLEEKRHASPLNSSELKQAYKRALLLHHPDKQKSTSVPLAERGATVATIDDIALAYTTLLDPSLRAEYDRQLRNGESKETTSSHVGIETVDLDDLDYNDTTGMWTRNCRCGSNPAFIVTETELEKNIEYGELAVGCHGCSLWLRVLFSAGE